MHCIQGVGIGQYTNQKMLLFEPELERTYSFYLYDAEFIGASIEGELSQYATIKDENPNGGPRNVQVIVKLPEYIEPGLHEMYFTANEIVQGGAGSVGGIAQVRVRLGTFALYPGKYPEYVGISADDTNLNESTMIKLYLSNKGEEAITSATGKATIYDQNDNVVTALDMNTRSINPFEDVFVSAVLDTSKFNMNIGTYRIVGEASYEDGTIAAPLEGKFTVGHLNVDIIDTTPELIVNATNKYYITLESDWSGDITDVYVKMSLPNGKVLKSPAVDLIKPGTGRKAAGQIEMYVETIDIPLGSYDVDLTVFYKNQATSKKVRLNIIDGVAPEIEKPKLITPSTIFIAVGIIIILFVAVYFFMIKKGPGDTNPSPRKEENTHNTTDIRPPTI